MSHFLEWNKIWMSTNPENFKLIYAFFPKLQLFKVRPATSDSHSGLKFQNSGTFLQAVTSER